MTMWPNTELEPMGSSPLAVGAERRHEIYAY
jgi:hypothetical protein